MYTVARFYPPTPERDDEVIAIIAPMNARRPDVDAHPHEKNGGVLCGVCKDPAWEVQVAEIRRFVADLGELVDKVVGMGGTVVFDVAVFAPDLKGPGRLVLPWTRDFLQEMASRGISLEISLYCPARG